MSATAGGEHAAPAILHVDMDAFYASVEVLDDPSLRGRPVIVGGTGPRGVVASCSYEARAYGVHSAMPSGRARQLCPHAVFLGGRFDRYAECSRRIHEIFHSVTPLVEGISLDEAFLDVTGARRRYGDPAAIGARVRSAIRDAIGLECAVGAGTSKLVAKLASRAAKPKIRDGRVDPGVGVFVVEPGQELAFLHPLPVGALWGVGPATERRLGRLGVATVGELAAVPVDTLVRTLGRAAGRQLHDLAWARDRRPVEPARETRSVSHEETYARDLVDTEAVRKEIVRLSDGVASRLRRAGLVARTVTLKVRYGDFTTITRSHTLTEPTDTAHDLAAAATALLDGVDVPSGVRLVGVVATNLVAGQVRQLVLGEDVAGSWEHATRAVDEVRARFGDAAVGPASLAGGRGLRVKRLGDTQWGPDTPDGEATTSGPGDGSG